MTVNQLADLVRYMYLNCAFGKRGIMLKIILPLSILLGLGCNGAHFRGGTISWKPSGKQNQTVEFKFKMAWSYGSGPGCNEIKIGQYVQNNFQGYKSWMCVNGCSTNIEVGPVYYYCTDAHKEGNWEQGENTFEYTFAGKGPFTISYTGAMWMPLSVPYSHVYGRWNLQTVVNLEERSDTDLPNSSPLAVSKPLYILQFNCEHELQIPMVDPDGDMIKCRWAEGKECDSICHLLPNALLNELIQGCNMAFATHGPEIAQVSGAPEETCTLKFNADAVHFKDDGWYALALTVEDFPKSPITIGNSSYNSSTPMTSVPVQFLVHTLTKPLGCKQKPIFVEPTPAAGSQISVEAGHSIQTKIYASNSMNPTANVTTISVTCPPGMTHTGPFSDSSRPGVVYWELQWTPIHNQKGDNIFCAITEDDSGQRSNSHCFSFIAWDHNPCESLPCYNNGTCYRKGSTANYECWCPGYAGTLCETEINECASLPCLNGGSCRDEVNGFTCFCPSEFTGKECRTEIEKTWNNEHDSCSPGYMNVGFNTCLSIGLIIGICVAVIGVFMICFVVIFRLKKQKNTKIGIECPNNNNSIAMKC